MLIRNVILFEHLELGKVLGRGIVKIIKNKSNLIIIAIIDVWNHTNFMCKNYILNVLE